MNGINDDGSKKKAKFGIKEFIKKLFGGNSNKSPVKGNNNDFYTHAEKLAKYQSSKFNISEEEALYNILNSKDYNYKGYFEEFGNLEPDTNGHFTDKYKTAYHDTFSNESIYSGKKSQYNPEGKIGGSWDNNGNFIRNKKQYGGMNNKQYNARVLGYIPSTGGQYQSNNRKRALLGTDGKWYKSEEDMPIGITKRKSLKDKLTDIYGPQGARYFLGNGILHGVSALTGLAGASANAISNAHYLNKMKSIVDSIKSYDIPITKLKTFYNINPQLSEVERKLGLTTRDIDANTASSQVALARKRNARYNASAEKNKLYAQKENIETQLINQDLLQQGETMARNIQNMQNVEHQKAMLNMQLLDKRSENETKMLETYAGILNQFANNGSNAIYNWLRYKAALAGNPNSVKAMENIP